jgi:hypothetical protein
VSPVFGLALDVLQIAHDIGVPHQEPPPTSGGGGGASPVVILVGVVLSLALVGALVWLKNRDG